MLIALLVVFPLAAHSKDKIVIGLATSLSGPLATIRGAGFQPIYEMWVDEVNKAGGIHVKEYGKKLPIEMIIHDDKSDVGTMTRLLEKLIVEDKVDFIFAPCGTASLFAAAAIAEKYGYILIGQEGGAKTLQSLGAKYYFSTLNTDIHQVPVLTKIFKEVGVKRAAITFLADLHGIEYSGTAVPQFELAGIDVAFVKSHSMEIKDMSHLLRAAKAANVDAFLCFTYPAQSILVTRQAMELGYNPKAFFLSVGPYGDFYKHIFGPAGVEGVMGCGAWNEKSSAASKAFSDRYRARYSKDPNYWGGTIFYASLECFGQAITKAGTLDQKKIRDIMATEKFDTVLGKTWWDGMFFAHECYPGHIGQWQKGVFEVIDPGGKRTAAPIFPKPAWPAPKK